MLLYLFEHPEQTRCLLVVFSYLVLPVYDMTLYGDTLCTNMSFISSLNGHTQGSGSVVFPQSLVRVYGVYCCVPMHGGI